MGNDKATIAFRIAFVGSLPNVNDPVAKAIKNLIIKCDKDFIPPLSSRGIVGGRDIENGDVKDVGVQDDERYFRIVLKQKNIVAYCEDNIVAFMSFRHNEPHDPFTGVVEAGDVVNYVTTICVEEKYRGYGIASRFYDFVENKNNDLPKEVYGDCVATRTWHTNVPHIELLKKRGYSLTHILVNDRDGNEPGEKLDTVYYCKRLVFAG